MLDIFRIPTNLADDFINFYSIQNCYQLSELDRLKSQIQPHIGVYALYYCGKNSLYTCISQANYHHCCLPIYIGKAIAGGRRRGKSSSSQNLYSRLREHQSSILQGSGIDIDEFYFKVAAMEFDLVSWGEGVLIRYYQPIWNQIIDGFGNHDPGKGRYQQRRSVWDVIHPGRQWSTKLAKFDTIDLANLKIKIEILCQEKGQQLGCF
jgi:hypothetical protein